MKFLKKSMPPLSSLIAFEAAARLSSFSAASKELGVSREAVSRQIRILESFLGLSLFNRESNSVTLNNAGQYYYSRVAPNLEAIAFATLGVATSTSPEVESENNNSFSGDKKTILIVDDTPDNLIYLHDILQNEYAVVAAKTGEEALIQINTGRTIDLIMLDICMPDFDGYQLCKHLKASASTKEIPVIFVTSLDDPMDETKGLEVGASDFLTHPVVPAVMKVRIKAQIELRTMKNKLEVLLKSRTDKLQEAQAVMKRVMSDMERFGKQD